MKMRNEEAATTVTNDKTAAQKKTTYYKFKACLPAQVVRYWNFSACVFFFSISKL